jgi:hypothetical protein
MSEIIHLKKPLATIGFYEREKVNGRIVANKCGRDFLYYVLNYHYEADFNSTKNNPLQIDRGGLFGYPMPAALAWTQLQFSKVPNFLNNLQLELYINKKGVKSFISFIQAILFARLSYEEAMKNIESAVINNQTVGIDISLGWEGLLDHVLFVYGYDEQNLYVVDTHKVLGLEYQSVEDSIYYYKLPKSTIKRRWTRFGRVWKVRKIPS